MNNDQELVSWRRVESPLETEGAPYAKAQRHFTRMRRVRERMVGMRLRRSDTLKRLESKGRGKGFAG